MEPYVLTFQQVDGTRLGDVGGKGANLGEMTHAGFPVPPGFCVTTWAYQEHVRQSRELDTLLDELEALADDDLERIASLGGRIRAHVQSLAMPADVRSRLLEAWRALGGQHAYAVRSSATAEDLPSASFAGQQDTYLNVRGEEPLELAVKRCWASLYTDRAIVYRARNGFGQRSVRLSVVVQRMILPEVSGILFTADPITGRRGTVSIDASFGLGEALVSGLVTADLYHVREGRITSKRIARKALAIWPLPDGGTVTRDLPPEDQESQALDDARILELASLGTRIEAHYGREQDIEWCFSGGEFFIVQSRPITSLYPPPRSIDGRLHLFFSFGHVQMMTDPLKPLGISVLRTIVPVGERARSGESELLQEAGSRIYFDLNPALRIKPLRALVPRVLPLADERIAQAIALFLERKDYLAAIGPGRRLDASVIRSILPVLLSALNTLLFRNLDGVFDRINRSIAERIEERRRGLEASAGPERIRRVRQMLSSLFPDLVALGLVQNVVPGVLAFRLIASLSERWLGDTAELANLSKSPPGNVTTEMGLALGDVADVVRAHPGSMERLKALDDRTLRETLEREPAADPVLHALAAFLDQYGMRGPGEIDLTRPRWREAPTQLLPAIEGYVSSPAAGQHRRAFQVAEEEAAQAKERLLERVKATRLGFMKVRILRRLIAVYRSRIGLREHPKFFLVRHLDLAKRCILGEAAALVDAGVLGLPEEIFWFSLAEVEEIVTHHRVDRTVVDARGERFARDAKLRPPRVITSEGEIVTAQAGAAVPAGALAGTAASAGIVEGRARIVPRLEESKLRKGEILVAPSTDPAWTPLFPLAAGLVTEVGGLMTHGAVVAREYGIPAVVAVDRATELIPAGALIRVNGTEGFVEILSNSAD